MSRGQLTIVATPIGNLSDLSKRALEEIETADVVACEDTRHTGRMLTRLGIRRPLVSLHEHNERQRVPMLLEKLSGGARVTLVSDAGTPLLSDPGFLLVRAAIADGFEVLTAPGPSAVIAALTVSGLPPYPFTFLGFPPRKSGKRRSFFRRYADLDHTLVIFESPHRLLATLEDLQVELGDRSVAIARELTKLHEEVLRGSLSELTASLADRNLKGEYVIVLGAPDD